MGNIKMAEYPIYFTDNTCIKCGAKGSLRFLDRKDHLVRDPIYQVSYIYCTKCGTKYYIDWLKKGSNFSRPICVSKQFVSDIESEMEKFALENKRSVKIS